MDLMTETIIEALQELFAPESIVLRNDSSSRLLEGLPQEVKVASGQPPEFISIMENDLLFRATLLAGQKTGWFYDMRPNRAWLQQIAEGRRMLDIFCYAGASGLLALGSGAAHATFIDSSALALQMATQSAQAIHLEKNCTFLESDAFAELARLKADGQQFDLVACDPPAFIKRKKDLEAGRRAYGRINEQAVALLSDGGFLLSASCSMHLTESELVNCVRQAAMKSGRQAQILKSGGQGLDHPVHPAIPETRYLKAILARIVKVG
jgi:23S rRNA (cytosine1962-C5)-methyltransferase